MSWYWVYILGILSGWVILIALLFLLKSYLIERIQKVQMKKLVDEFNSPGYKEPGGSEFEPTEAELKEAQAFIQGLIKGGNNIDNSKKS